MPTRLVVVLAIAIAVFTVGFAAAPGHGGNHGAAPAVAAPPSLRPLESFATPAHLRPLASLARTVRLLRSHGAPVPILEYHVIAAPRPGAPYPGLYVTPGRFRAQVLGLARAGYHGVTLGDVFAYWDRGVPLPRRPVVVSFDDGYLSHYTHALPVLRRLGWPGTLNLELANLRTHGGLSPRMVRTMIDGGWEVDSHTLTHPDLTTVSDTRLRRELVGSRLELRRRFGVPASFFCYPAGRYDARVVAAVERAGYRGAVVEGNTLAAKAQPFELGRLEVDEGASPQSLMARFAAR